jgi:hypothetical protein
MSKIAVASLRSLFLVLFVAAFAAPQAAEAAGLSVFEGKYNGKYTGVLAVGTGANERLIADAMTQVKTKGTSGKFVIKGTLNGTGYIYTISLKRGRATLSSFFPGAGGVYGNSATGTYKLRGKNLKINIVNPAGVPGTLNVKIGFTTGGSTLLISTVITRPDGDPIYATVIGT